MVCDELKLDGLSVAQETVFTRGTEASRRAGTGNPSAPGRAPASWATRDCHCSATTRCLQTEGLTTLHVCDQQRRPGPCAAARSRRKRRMSAGVRMPPPASPHAPHTWPRSCRSRACKLSTPTRRWPRHAGRAEAAWRSSQLLTSACGMLSRSAESE